MITNFSYLEQASKLVNCEGDPCDFGCTEGDIDKMIAHAKEKFPAKPYRVVSNWCWGDLEVAPGQVDIFHRKDVLPCFIYANKIIQDERAPWDKGLSVRTTLLVEFHRDCIFTTRNSNYILVGSGSRMTVHPSVFTSLFF